MNWKYYRLDNRTTSFEVKLNEVFFLWDVRTFFGLRAGFNFHTVYCVIERVFVFEIDFFCIRFWWVRNKKKEVNHVDTKRP